MHWIVLGLLAVLGVPLFAVIAGGAMLGYLGADIPLASIAIEILGVATLPALVAIPLFCFAGYVLAESPAPRLLVRLSEALVGWMPGGLAVFALAICALFTAFTGASGITIIAMGALLYPALKQARYPEGFSLGLVTTGGSLGLLFAPSLPLILYGVVSETRIDSLFRAGVLPGLAMIVLLAAYCLWVNRSERRPLSSFDWREVAGAVRAAGWELPLPVIVLGGIYSGYFAISEAAAVTALYVVIVEVFIRRAIPLSRLPLIMRDSMTLVGGILLILAVSLASTNLMIDAEVPQRLLAVVGKVVSGPVTFMLALLVFLLILGAFLDIFSAIVLVVPLILPVAAQFGVHPVHLGIIFLATMQLGYLTPPVGLNLFIASYRFEQPIVRVYLASLPFLLVLMASVLLIAFWPSLSLWMIGT
ncbi:MAG: TRAP transporter large permease subunit [Gammaproteobacteria bacterium]|nr:TRAP transporter large permease subunit [Gammaproteobacteria bacterium]MYF66859.1 TRAP transporter large permease subunit [Gammaproteobacteria bacterium]MYK36291.1 TRAP transporter large permease subunit [Gammaproteobacteria bacterium]